MDLPVASWYEAIKKRHSVRKYISDSVSYTQLAGIERVCSEFRPFSGSRAVIVREPKSDVFKGLIGPLLKVKEAPHYVAFIGDTEVDHYETSLGYLGEGVVLEATSRGVNTCWVTGFFRPDRVEADIVLKESERVIGVTPLGYAKDPAERVGASTDKEHNRRPLSELIESGRPDEKWKRVALNAARLAPSAINRQPWRFNVTPDSITVSYGGRFDLGTSKAIDCGIAMLHLELGAKHSGERGEWKMLPDSNVARFELGQ